MVGMLLFMQLCTVALTSVDVTAYTDITTTAEKYWKTTDIGKLIPDTYLVTLRTGAGLTVDSSVATLRQELHHANFE